jgi:hypothetical protein
MTSSPYAGPFHTFRRWSWRGWGYRHDLIDRDYMERWTLTTPLGQIRLHNILRSDNDRHHHDHPFDFVSLILSGGYLEHRPNKPVRICLPKTLVWRRAEDLHFLKLLGGCPAWTLVLAAPKRRSWGFATEEGWVDARDYDEWMAMREAVAS